jgi:hypothetical protein
VSSKTAVINQSRAFLLRIRSDHRRGSCVLRARYAEHPVGRDQWFDDCHA